MAIRRTTGGGGTFGSDTTSVVITVDGNGEIAAVEEVAIAAAGAEPGDLTWSARATKTGWLLCDGAAVSRTTYSDLFDEIGETFGVGDGSTTFNLPDGQGQMLLGAGLGFSVGDTGGDTTLGHTENFAMQDHTHAVGTLAGPSHTHTLADGYARINFASGAEGRFQRKTGVTSWSATLNVPAGGAAGADTTNACQLAGATDSGGTGAVTGATGAVVDSGDLELVGGINDHTGVRPPYLAANLFIKT